MSEDPPCPVVRGYRVEHILMIDRPFTVAQALAVVREPGEDRLDVIAQETAPIAVVADGAGGLAGGARAAELLVELVREGAALPAFDPRRPDVWIDLLARADLHVDADRDAGETTGVVLAVAEGLVVGASCGDSGAWIIQTDGSIEDLTARQHRKLRLGSGRARPVTFSRSRGRSGRGAARLPHRPGMGRRRTSSTTASKRRRSKRPAVGSR